MSSSSSSILAIIESPPKRGSTAGGDEIATPTKVALSSAQNSTQAITPGYMETDIELLSVEAGHHPLLPAEEREVAQVPDARERNRELFRQIAVSFCALTLSHLQWRALIVGDSMMARRVLFYRLWKLITI
jgi:hypothetical protein